MAKSSVEAEFCAMVQGICKLLWLKIILEGLKIKWDDLMRLYCDNIFVIRIAHNPIQHNQTEHIEINKRFIKKKLYGELICTPYASTNRQFVDILTKCLSNTIFQVSVLKLRTKNIYSPA